MLLFIRNWNKDHHGKGLVQGLLAFALRLAVEFSQRVGFYAVVVDAKHDKAKAFYVRLGFVACVDNPLCLYLPVATLKYWQIFIVGCFALQPAHPPPPDNTTLLLTLASSSHSSAVAIHS